jgi:hypothetical protein
MICFAFLYDASTAANIQLNIYFIYNLISKVWFCDEVNEHSGSVHR